MYSPELARDFYDAYGDAEWLRLEASAYGRLKAIIRTDFIQRYVEPGHRVLDAGSGLDRFSIEAARLGSKVTALDISQRQLDLARERFAEAAVTDRIERTVQADIVDISMFEDGQFDVTVCYGGALSYVCERRGEAAAQLVRVTRPSGVLLASVMCRYAAGVNAVRQPILRLLADPEALYLWNVVSDGDLPAFPSQTVEAYHPAMHLFSAEEITSLLTEHGCEVLEIAGSNVTATEGSPAIETVALDLKTWATAIELERRLNTAPGLNESGGHMIVAARRKPL
ncbi:MAG: class I SAM-dependent methyltransferase [Chloroflexi bacterium]|nr:class I SAM-dependent methyltransferase [Chloroflexota bacterium]